MARSDDDIHRGAYAIRRDDGIPSPLAFVREREKLVARFLLAEVLAPPLALRGRGPGMRRARRPSR